MGLNDAKSRLLGWLALTAALVAGAATLVDGAVARWAHDSGIAARLEDSPHLSHVLRFEGNFAFTAVACIALLLAAWARGARRGAGLWEKPAIVLLAGVFSGINTLFKWCFGRIRPYHGVAPFDLHPFRGGLHGLFVQEGLSFPSGDTTMAFAMAASMSIAVPGLWPLWWFLGIIVTLQRVAANAHYPSDALAGAALGIALALLAQRIIRILARGAGQLPDATAMAQSGDFDARAS